MAIVTNFYTIVYKYAHTSIAIDLAPVCYREPDKQLDTVPIPRSARPQTGVRPQSTLRPPSARPAAPRIRDRGEVQIIEESRWSIVYASW